MKKLTSIASVLFCLLLLLSLFPSLSYASERTYTITETELTQLENNLNELKRINENLRTESMTQGTELTKLRTELTEAEIASLKLRNQISALKEKSTEQEKLLATANESLKKSEEEAKRTEKRLRRQRDTWAIAVGVVSIIAVAK